MFPSLVRRLGGMNEAAVVQTIHFASQISATQDDQGLRWVTMTAAQIGRRTGLSEDASLRALKSLREMGVLIARTVPRRGRALMWAVDLRILEGSATRDSAVGDTAIPRDATRDSAVCTTTKKSEDTAKNSISPIANKQASAVVIEFVERFRALHRSDPDRSSIGRLARDAKRMLEEGRPLEVVIAAAHQCADRGHANLPSALTHVLTTQSREPKGFRGIREFLETEASPEPQ